MTLPVEHDYAPMEARVVEAVPAGPEWQYEPKWDGFRCLAFRDGEKIELRSKSGQPLTRYFPEIVEALGALEAKQFVIDGEIVVPVDGALSFDALLQRIHPAQSRVNRLAAETPATVLVFDILVDARGTDLTDAPLTTRRPRLEAFAKANFVKSKFAKANAVNSWARVELSPATTRLRDAKAWLAGRAGTDGVIAKRVDVPYASGERTAMVKIKRKRTADCVVGGFRYATKGKVIGSLLLGLYGNDGLLHHVGFTSSFTNAERAEITPRVEKLRGGEGFTGRAPGGPSRWSTKRSSEWEPLRLKLVVEVEYDHYTGGRFRHGTKFLRWRPDKAPAQCLLSQVAEARTEAKATTTREAKTGARAGVKTPAAATRAQRATKTTTARQSRRRKSSSSH